MLGQGSVEQKRGSNPEAIGREHVQDRSMCREGAGDVGEVRSEGRRRQRPSRPGGTLRVTAWALNFNVTLVEGFQAEVRRDHSGCCFEN